MSGEYRRMMNCGLPIMLYTLHCINKKIHFRKSNMFFCFSFRFIIRLKVSGYLYFCHYFITNTYLFSFLFSFRILSKLMFLYIVILCIFNSMLLYTYYIISLRMLIHIVNYCIREKTS